MTTLMRSLTLDANMDSEIHYEGWLIKSPPTKRIWRARWRRRWFALKQGELPGQYLLEYYTDQSCRKMKGVIDLGQCEQVDAGLFMERKFQHVFNVKTPQRTYYLAADTDHAMRYWVNCICNVCGLQDMTKLAPDEGDDHEPPQLDSLPAVVYQNNEFAQKISEPGPQNEATSSWLVSTIPQSKGAPTGTDPHQISVDEGAGHDYYNDDVTRSVAASVAAAARKRPENLKLGDVSLDTGEPSPALSTSSGPYISICECFSGNPVAPLNSLSRSSRFDVPKSPLNIHLNLTGGPNSPGAAVRSSDESESVFTDDDEASSHSGSHMGVVGLSEAQLRRLRPSDSSVENESIGWTAMQRFSKMPSEEKFLNSCCEPPPRPPKRPEAAIGPSDSSSCVLEERYEIPRSHRLPPSATALGDDGQSHFYSNAAPSTSLEEHVFRYDFGEGGVPGETSAPPPPVINRSLKPRPSGTPRTSLVLGGGGRQSAHVAQLSHSDDKLQYLDLDHTNGPLPVRLESNVVASASAHNIHVATPALPGLGQAAAAIKHSTSEHTTVAPSSSSGRGIVYKTVDFVKTDAFNRTRQDAEINRASKDK